MSSFFLSLWLITSLLFSETTTRHHVDVDGEYLALDILDTAGKVNIPDPFMSPDYSQLSPCGHTAITNTPIIRTTAKSQCKNELQIFDWNKLRLMRTLNRVPSMSAVKWVNCKWSAFLSVIVGDKRSPRKILGQQYFRFSFVSLITVFIVSLPANTAFCSRSPPLFNSQANCD